LLVGVLGGVGFVHDGVDKRFKDMSLLQRLVMVEEEERMMEERGLSGGGVSWYFTAGNAEQRALQKEVNLYRSSPRVFDVYMYTILLCP